MKIELTLAVIACLKRGLNCWPLQNDDEGIEIKEILEQAEELEAAQEWVGLTDEEIKDIVGRNDSGGIGAYTREMFTQIESKLKKNNT